MRYFLHTFHKNNAEKLPHHAQLSNALKNSRENYVNSKKMTIFVPLLPKAIKQNLHTNHQKYVEKKHSAR